MYLKTEAVLSTQSCRQLRMCRRCLLHGTLLRKSSAKLFSKVCFFLSALRNYDRWFHQWENEDKQKSRHYSEGLAAVATFFSVATASGLFHTSPKAHCVFTQRWPSWSYSLLKDDFYARLAEAMWEPVWLDSAEDAAANLACWTLCRSQPAIGQLVPLPA